MPYGCPRCNRIVPLEDVDLQGMKLFCESCGQRFGFARPDELWRDGPPPPPPPVDLFAVPVNVDVSQPGDGTMELRIRHWQRLRHGPEALVVFHWLGLGSSIALFALSREYYVVGGVFGVLTILGIPPARRLVEAWRTRTLMRWDRVTGQIRSWAEVRGVETGPARVANLTRARIELVRGSEGPQVAAVDGGETIALTGPLPISVGEWVTTTLEIVRKADLRAAVGEPKSPPATAV